jgi:prepilin-type processing-associated H-X9-DG protein
MGMTLCTSDNDDRLPFAYIQYDEWESVAWDGLIYSFVLGDCEISSSSLDKENDLLRCPVDTMGDRTRTYAMPQHDMNSTNWPPGPKNGTGVGLWWSCWAEGNASLTEVVSIVGKIPAVRLEMIRAPASTLLLTEHASSVNSMFAYNGATISGPNDHLDTKTRRMNRYHNGKFNYLMVDGHVELLLPAQKQGIWTIQPND